MKTVREILLKKGYNICSVSPDETIFNALKFMSVENIGALLVVKEGRVVGIISERDYARKVIPEEMTSKNILVKDIMSEKVIFVDTDTLVEECMALMINKRIRHLPVYENDKLFGIISIGDVVKAVIDEKEFVISQLVHYIKDTPPIEVET